VSSIASSRGSQGPKHRGQGEDRAEKKRSPNEGAGDSAKDLFGTRSVAVRVRLMRGHGGSPGGGKGSARPVTWGVTDRARTAAREEGAAIQGQGAIKACGAHSRYAFNVVFR